MASLKRVLATLTASLGLAAASLSLASPAHADTWHCNKNAGPGGRSHVCIRSVPDGYDAQVWVTSEMSGHTVDFTLTCANGHWFGDAGSFPVIAFKEYSYVFQVGSQGACQVLLYDSTLGQTWASPWISR
ncbi:hypothetical protein [Wenjunlia tyrosinilytica]|uniref:Secreted protein n=1 Tax=Wenjunlia tyrosinilytica TaxID=1544741 RepID=A0A917ZSV2_9ACTN|nr:hypothetical protein [Wenjunlia tyrosinilytica]GGO93394.1 hypothetical protein GCM10012280_45830 [Wenjunlia tyrosinilytica]